MHFHNRKESLYLVTLLYVRNQNQSMIQFWPTPIHMYKNCTCMYFVHVNRDVKKCTKQHKTIQTLEKTFALTANNFSSWACSSWSPVPSWTTCSSPWSCLNRDQSHRRCCCCSHGSFREEGPFPRDNCSSGTCGAFPYALACEGVGPIVSASRFTGLAGWAEFQVQNDGWSAVLTRFCSSVFNSAQQTGSERRLGLLKLGCQEF